ncbi:MAG TPA: flagellar hook-associated protein FlgK [Candidatus Dormibacteraeota bacterium]|nr:flagellar hook-associated protein FlgK [Candidatus Dormibacteraeota bacterium]
MSFFGIDLLGTALANDQTAANVTSQDISNVNTPGASRQVVNLVEATPIAQPGFPSNFGPGMLGEGVTIQSIQRVHQASYDTLYRNSNSVAGFFTAEQGILNVTQTNFSEPAGNGINAAFSGFMTSLQQLASQPTALAQRSGVMTAAQTLTNSLNSASQSILTQETQIQSQASDAVTQVNTMLDQIASLNGQIRASTAVGDNPNQLLDQRDQLIDQLSGYLNVQTSVQANGSTLVSVGGQALVNDTVAYHLAGPVVAKPTAPGTPPQMVIGFAGSPTPNNPSPVPITGGSLGGMLDAYNAKLVPYLQQLNDFASGLANAANRISESSYDSNGNQGAALFIPNAPGNPITAASIRVGLTDAGQVLGGLASTAAGTLVTPLNSANNTVASSQSIEGNSTYATTMGVGTYSGSMTVSVDGQTETYGYTVTSSTTLDQFIAQFNEAGLGVTMSFNPNAQSVVFQRDPTNESLALGGTSSYGATADFTIQDAIVAGGPPPPSILSVLGASGINGVTQNASNALGSADNAGVNAMLQTLQGPVAIPSFTPTTLGTAVAGAGTFSVTPGSLTGIEQGASVVVDAGTPNQETVTVQSVDYATGSFTATFTKPHAATATIQQGAQASLGSYYSDLVTKIGFDAQTAINGSQSQTQVTQQIDSARQSVDGINIDEETQNLIKFQNSYQAVAKTLSVMEQMLQTMLTTL